MCESDYDILTNDYLDHQQLRLTYDAADATNSLLFSAMQTPSGRNSRRASPFPPKNLISPPGCRIFALDSKVGEQLFEARRMSVR